MCRVSVLGICRGRYSLLFCSLIYAVFLFQGRPTQRATKDANVTNVRLLTEGVLVGGCSTWECGAVL